ncbi:hypothetical protein L7F22_065368 [Adiantum nelumboides]|nr:hypothetical protein [Adiantum nelumboides]
MGEACRKPSSPSSCAASASASKLTVWVVLCSVLGGGAGLMYGYDLVVAGGVSLMHGFLATFFPSVLLASERGAMEISNYCKYNNQLLQLYSSCPSLAALAASFLAGRITRTRGHVATLAWSAALFWANTALAAAAQNLPMLFLARILLGVGIGFSSQAIAPYVSEIAPAKFRGALNFIFSINVAAGLFLGNLVVYWTAHYEPWGWRLALGLAGVPSMVLTIASFVLLNSPTYLIQQGKQAMARQNLAKLRGSDDVDDEFGQLVEATEQAEKRVNASLFQRRYAPQVVMAVALPLFQQVSGNDAIMFYDPFLFKAAGLGSNASFYSGVFTGLVALVGTLASTFIVDRAGRRTILTVASLIMFLSISIIGFIFALGLRHNTGNLSHISSMFELVLVCLFIGVYRGSWGPLAWLIPGEIFPQEIRSKALSVTVFVNMLIKFTIAQTFLSMLCTLRFGIFFFFAAWLAIMGTFILFLLPETKGLPLDRVQELWKSHWFWGPILKDQDCQPPQLPI